MNQLLSISYKKDFQKPKINSLNSIFKLLILKMKLIFQISRIADFWTNQIAINLFPNSPPKILDFWILMSKMNLRIKRNPAQTNLMMKKLWILVIKSFNLIVIIRSNFRIKVYAKIMEIKWKSLKKRRLRKQKKVQSLAFKIFNSIVLL